MPKTQLAPSGTSQIYWRDRAAHRDHPAPFSAKDGFWRKAAVRG